MASSFDPLRRYSKVIFTILGVICMFTFVVGSQLEQLLAPDRNQGRNEVVATWSGGTVREDDIYRMRLAHNRVQRFLGGVVTATRAAGGEPRRIGLPSMQGERQLLQNMILAQEADRIGITVDDKSVEDYLNDFSAFKLTPAQIDAIALEATGPTVSRDELYEQLKRELVAQEVQYALGLVTTSANVSVADAWDYYCRLHRQLTIEAYPFPTESFVSEVSGGPNEAEKRKIFEEFRLNDPNPDSAEPGFYRPLKLAFAYAKIDTAPFLEEAKKTVTEEQIKEEYEKQVKQGDLKVPVEPPKKEEDKKPEEDKPDEKKQGDAKEGDKKPEPELNPPKAADAKEEKPADPPKKSCGGEEEGDELAQAEPAKEPAAKQPEKKDPEKKEPAATTPAEQPPADPAKTDPDKTEPEKKPEPEMRTKTLDEVREEIHTRLAQPEVNKKVQAAADGVSNEIRDYYTKYLRYQEASKRKIEGVSADKPEPLDIEAIAKKYGAVGSQTKLVDQYGVMQHDIATDGFEIDFQALQRGLPWQYSFVDLAFNSGAQLFNPQEIRSRSGAKYVYCVTEKKDPETPKFEDTAVQEEIKAAWKKGQALKLARAAAEKVAAAAKDKESLKDAAPDGTKVLTPHPFTYLTYRTAQRSGNAFYSEVKEVPNAQREFFEAIYNLPVGGTAVTTDAGLNTVYAVKLMSQLPSDEELRERFLAAPNWPEIGAVAQIERGRRTVTEVKKLEQRYNLKWSRPDRYLGAEE